MCRYIFNEDRKQMTDLFEFGIGNAELEKVLTLIYIYKKLKPYLLSLVTP